MSNAHENIGGTGKNLSHEIDEMLSHIASPALPNIELSLGRMQALLDALGNPEKQLPPIIHVAGTNGKGSCIAFLQAIYLAAGYRAHAYVSPHLVRFNERIILYGEAVSDADLLCALKRVDLALKQCDATYFEATTAAAFLCYAQNKADILLLETGLGGMFDATNVVPHKLASIITSIAYDHQDFLGETLQEIAQAKAGIVSKNGLCVSVKQPNEAAKILHEKADACSAKIMFSEPLDTQMALSLTGAHQRENAGLACATVRALNAVLPVGIDQISKGLGQAVWPARLQKLCKGPLTEQHPDISFYLDGAHNPHAAEALAAWLKTQPAPRYLWLGMRQGKNASQVIATLAESVQSITLFPIADCADSYSAKALTDLASEASGLPIEICAGLDAAANGLNCGEKATVLICGSLYLAKQVLKTHT
jgi:dihydrofolate synthase/folylpolyglutamate synthase